MTTKRITYQEVTWTDISHPTPDDIAALGKQFPNFHPLNLQDCLTELEYPKLDHHDHYLFLVVQMPFWNAKERISRPAEVDIFVAQNQMVTSHRGELKPLVEMFAAVEADEARRAELLGNGASSLLYHILNTLVDYCFPIVHDIGLRLRRIENDLFQNNFQKLLHEVAILRREIIILRSILRPQLEIVDLLIQGSWPFIEEHLDPYWGDIGDHLTQLCMLTDQYAEVISGLSDTLDTLASHRIDGVMRLLTITTILTLPVTLLATVFGMNVVMPYADHPLLFFAVVVIGILLTVWLIWYLRTRRML